MAKSPLERAARALCSLAGTPENTTFDVFAAGGEQISTEGFKLGAQVAACTWDRMTGAILEGK